MNAEETYEAAIGGMSLTEQINAVGELAKVNMQLANARELHILCRYTVEVGEYHMAAEGIKAGGGGEEGLTLDEVRRRIDKVASRKQLAAYNTERTKLYRVTVLNPSCWEEMVVTTPEALAFLIGTLDETAQETGAMPETYDPT